ncbi:MAG: sigma-E factor negative regulatory protein [Steroidobacterales bacterium]
MNQEQVESQLSAMFDGELPAAECELLSRRIDREESLRARWSRYAMIGAVMRSEPVAAVGSGFSARVSAALSAEVEAAEVEAAERARKAAARGRIQRGALAAALVAAIAGVSVLVLMMRNVAGVPALVTAPAAVAASTVSPTVAAAAAPVQVAANAVGAAAVAGPTAHASAFSGNGEPLSYVTPLPDNDEHLALRSQLANYVVAHSEYSAPLMRRNLLSALVSSDEAAEYSPPSASIGASIGGNEQADVGTTAPHGSR